MTTRKTLKIKKTGEEEVKLYVKSLKGRIVQARSASGISQMKLAENLGIHVTTLNKYERGKRVPDAGTLSRIVDVTGCSSGWLLTGDDTKGGKTFEGEREEVTTKYISLLEQNVKKLEQENEGLKEKLKKSSAKSKSPKKK
jgi:transcriptional regulator with XRE-family HTH domain